MSRQPLGEISGNSNYRGGIEGRFELTPYWRSHIVGRAAAGQDLKDIATDLNIPPPTVQSTISRAWISRFIKRHKVYRYYTKPLFAQRKAT